MASCCWWGPPRQDQLQNWKYVLYTQYLQVEIKLFSLETSRIKSLELQCWVVCHFHRARRPGILNAILQHSRIGTRPGERNRWSYWETEANALRQAPVLRNWLFSSIENILVEIWDTTCQSSSFLLSFYIAVCCVVCPWSVLPVWVLDLVAALRCIQGWINESWINQWLIDWIAQFHHCSSSRISSRTTMLAFLLSCIERK